MTNAFQNVSVKNDLFYSKLNYYVIYNDIVMAYKARFLINFYVFAECIYKISKPNPCTTLHVPFKWFS